MGAGASYPAGDAPLSREQLNALRAKFARAAGGRGAAAIADLQRLPELGAAGHGGGTHHVARQLGRSAPPATHPPVHSPHRTCVNTHAHANSRQPAKTRGADGDGALSFPEFARAAALFAAAGGGEELYRLAFAVVDEDQARVVAFIMRLLLHLCFVKENPLKSQRGAAARDFASRRRTGAAVRGGGRRYEPPAARRAAARGRTPRTRAGRRGGRA